MYNHIVHTDDFRPMPLFQDSKFWGKNVGARAHLQQWLLRPCMYMYTMNNNNVLYNIYAMYV